MSDNSFTGASLEKALRDDTITQSGIFLVGMVKSADKEGFISFTKSGCENWVDLPINTIEQAEKIGHQPCKDHSHPLMRITLKCLEIQKRKSLLHCYLNRVKCQTTFRE